MSLTIAS